MKLLSVLIPARNEVFLQKTIDDVLDHAHGDTEVIAVCDGYAPDPPLRDRPGLRVLYNEQPIGQRQATNQAARESTAKYVMKLDAHCSVDDGFDVKLAADCEPDWTVLPVMRHLEAFRWVCSCGQRFPQGPQPTCHDIHWEYVWRPREGRGKTIEFMFIDPELRARYFDGKAKREYRWKDHYAKHAEGEICDVMVGMGPGWFMERERYWQLGGMDEGHGGWGQMGVEVACKAWLSGGRHVVNRKTWFAHMFRTRPGFSWPYKMTNAEIEKARAYSRDLWINDKWPLAKRPFRWLLEHFAPVPGWPPLAQSVPVKPNDLTILYYTHSRTAEPFASRVRERLREVAGNTPIVSVSQKPLDFGHNICVGQIGQSLQNIYRQALIGAKEVKTPYVALCEDDCLYTREHLDYRPKPDRFAYNLNRWLLHADSEPHVYSYRERPILCQCIAPTKLLIECLEARRPPDVGPDEYGEPGPFEEARSIRKFAYETFRTATPNVVLAHRKNTSGRRYHGKDAELRSELPPWGTAREVLEDLHLMSPAKPETTIVYYSCNNLPFYFERATTGQIKAASQGKPIISVTHKPLPFGTNICVGPMPRCDHSIFKQILRGAEAAETRYVALAECDCLYTEEHFNFVPPRDDTFYYNSNNWWGFWNGDRHAEYSWVKRKALSQLVCNRELLIRAMRRNLELYEKGLTIRKGIAGACEPGACRHTDAFVGPKSAWDALGEYDDYRHAYFETALSNVDIRHSDNLNKGRRGSKTKADRLEPWGRFFPWMQRELLRRYRNKYGLRRHKIMSVADLHDNRLDYAQPGGEKSVEWFNEVFPPFVKQIHEGKSFTHEDFEKEPYFKYLVSKLHRADRDPLTGKGKRHVFAKMQDVIHLYHDIKANGLRNPLDFYLNGRRMCLYRGGRRAEILWILGHKEVPARVYASKTAMNYLSPPPDLVYDGSINELGMKQFGELSDRATDKYWLHQYLFLYDKHLGHIRASAKTVLEIGLMRGASLLLWRDAFPKAHIYGIDNNARRPWEKLVRGKDRISVMLGRQEDEAFLREQVIPKGPFDLIVDDGSHHPPDTKRSFELLWPHVRRGGFYVIEDLCGNYRPDRIMLGPTVERIKQEIETMNETAEIAGIYFHYNICFLEKA